MASRAESVAALEHETPAGDLGPVVHARQTTLRGAIRAAASDAYFHSWRLLPANVVWSVTAIAIAAAIAVTPAAIILLPILALPTAGIFRVTTRIVRGEAVSFWDAVDAWRSDVLATLAIGAGLALAATILAINAITGFTSDSALGWAFATLAAWGLVALWLLAWAAWPILVDPVRGDRPRRERLRLAALLVLAHPLRITSFGLVLAVFLALSTVAVVALVTVSVAFAALVASRFVLPAADRLEERLTLRATSAAEGLAPTEPLA